MKLTDAELSELERLDCESKELVMADPTLGCLCPFVYNARLWSKHATALIAEARESCAKLAKADALHAAAVGVMGLLDSGYLVRNTDDDAKPGFAMRQIEPMMKLKAMQAAIEGWVAK